MSVVSCLYWYHVVLVLWFSSPQFSPIRSLLSFPPRRSASNKPFLLSPPPNKQLIADVSSSNSRDGGRSIREWRSATGDAVSQSCHLPKASPEPSKPRLNPKIRCIAS
ncbi:hypothetical protein BHE74_00028426 [Ensete ventricosum]|nr:hypothetical protein BHE74_00028426 [Ensete ventricosum]